MLATAPRDRVQARRRSPFTPGRTGCSLPLAVAPPVPCSRYVPIWPRRRVNSIGTTNVLLGLAPMAFKPSITWIRDLRRCADAVGEEGNRFASGYALEQAIFAGWGHPDETDACVLGAL